MSRPVVLVLPPLVPELTQLIYPSVPLLAAVLETAGHTVVQRDLNRAFVAHLLSPQTQKSVFSRAAKTVATAHHQQRLSPQALGAYSTAFLTCLSSRFVQLNPERVAQPHPHRAPSTRRDRELRGFLDPLFTFVRGEATETGGVLRTFLAEEADAISSLDPSLVGISVPMGPQLDSALTLARLLKDARPSLRVVLGGPVMSLLDPMGLSAALATSHADGIVRFEGERSILALAQGAALAKVANLVRLAQGRLVMNEIATPPRLTELPLPAWREEDLAAVGDAPLSILHARGCYWGRCAYCDYIHLYADGRYREARAEHVVSQMRALGDRHGVRSFQLVTESLSAPSARRLADAIERAGLDVRWATYMRVDPRMDAALATRLSRAGLAIATVGVESFCDRVLQRVSKGHTRAEAERFLEAFRDADTSLWVNLIPDLPTTTEAEALDSLDVLKRHVYSRASSIDGVNVFPFALTRSSQIGAEPERFGLRLLATDPSTERRIASANGDAGANGNAKHFAANDLAFEDLEGMDDRTKRRVLDAYRALSDEVATRDAVPQLRRWLADLDALPLRFRRQDVMLAEAMFPLRAAPSPSPDKTTSGETEAAQTTVLYCAPDGRLLHVHERLFPIFMVVSSGETFYLSEVLALAEAATGLDGELARDQSRTFVEQLVRYGLVEPDLP